MPSLLLGYLAFRGVQNDRALREKNRADEHRRIGERISQTLDNRLRTAEHACQEFLSRGDLHNSTQMFARLDNIKKEHPLVGEVFTFFNSGKIRFLATSLLFYSSVSISSPDRPLLDTSILQMLREGEQEEFQNKDYRRALSLYKQALQKTSAPHIRGNMLGKMARVQKKAGLSREAINTYQKIAAEHSTVQITKGIPMGLAARLEIGALHIEREEFTKAWSVFIQSYMDLINGEWMLEKEPFNFYAERIKKNIAELPSEGIDSDQLLSYKSQFQELVQVENSKRAETERLLLFQEKAFSDWEEDLLPVGTNHTPENKRLTLEIGTNEYLVCLFQMHSTENGIWGLLIDSSTLRSRILPDIFCEFVPSDENDWIVRGRNGEPILASASPPHGSLTIKSSFRDNFPGWTIEFYQAEPRFLEDFLLSRRGIYFYTFILIAGILIFGLILTIRSITQEMELSRMKSDFVSTVSHEFKSPLTSIRQIAEMLETGRIPSEARRQKYYEILLEQSERLSLLTENVLSLAKMEEGKRAFVFEQTDIKALLMEVVSTIQDRVKHDGFAIEIEIEDSLPPIKADVAGITQAITNLIDNAIKYSGESKKVDVDARFDEPHLTVSVKDYGVGINKEEFDKIFDRFYRGGDELTRTVKGSGLGLTLVKQIVEAHKGSIGVESEAGKGSVFTIKLPIDPNIG